LPRIVSLTLSLQAFQHALSELVASPPLCLAVREGGADFFHRFDLSEMEKDRLLEVVWQRGMSVSCSMYRSNRVTPIYTLLNFTCVLLAGDLKKELDEYWTSSSLPDLQFKQEIERFSQYLKRRIASGAITNPFLEEVLNFELAMNELRYIPRRRILQRIREAPAANEADPLQLNPLIRVVQFRHEPFELLDLLRQKRAIPDQSPSGEFFVLLSAVEEQMDIKPLDTNLGNILIRIQADGRCWRRSGEFRDLLLAGLVVPAMPEEADRESAV
jgi:hypothetical protein